MRTAAPIVIWLFRGLGRLPLFLNQFLGTCLGWLAGLLAPRHRKMTRANLEQYARASGLDADPALLASAFREQGKGVTELAIAWTAPLARLHALVVECRGWQAVEAAQEKGQAIIFVSPHLGCYELAGRYVESRMPVQAMYRPPKLAWVEPLMQEGRNRGGGSSVPATASGVKSLLKTLKQGGAIMILPDQVPGEGEGVWAEYFGKPAYTMTLLPRLAASAKAAVLFLFAERLPAGTGYRVVIEPLPEAYSGDRAEAARQTNAMVEKLVRMAPAQYLWSYNRYKHPAGAPLPPAPTETSPS